MKINTKYKKIKILVIKDEEDRKVGEANLSCPFEIAKYVVQNDTAISISNVKTDTRFVINP